MPYLDPDLLDDEGAVAEGNLAAIADIIEGWQPSEGDFEVALIEAVSIVIATAMAEIKSVERNNYAGFGERILNLTRAAATPSGSQVTITVQDALGYTIPAGFQAVFATPDGDSVAVATTVDAVVAPGDTEVGAVPVASLEAGEDQNGATGSSIDRDPLDYVDAVTLEQPTTGGADEEALQEYLDEVVQKAQRLSFLPLTPADYAYAALEQAGVFRCIVKNRYDPATAPADAPGHVTLIAVDPDGAAINDTQQAALELYLTSVDQLLGAIVHTEDVTTVSIDVDVTLKAADGYTASDAETAAAAAINALLDPAQWNYDTSEPGYWKKGVGQVTIFDIDRVIDDLPAVKQVVTVQLNGATSPVAVGEYELAAAGTVTCTAV